MMLELNISFIFHLFFIIIGCRIITFFLNKLYDNVTEYKEKENNIAHSFITENKILQEKKIDIEEKFNHNSKEIQKIINDFIISNKIILLQKSKNTNIKININNNEFTISEKQKILIDRYFENILKKIN